MPRIPFKLLSADLAVRGASRSALLVLACLCTNQVAAAQRATAARASQLQELLAIEDSRTADADSLRPLIGAIRDPRAAIRVVAARALGRMERSAFLPVLFPALRDPSAAVRIEAANAVAQIGRAQSQLSNTQQHEAVDSLLSALERERDPEVIGVLARSLGRMARADSVGARVAERLSGLLTRTHTPGRSNPAEVDPRSTYGVVQGIFSLSRTRRNADGTRSLRNPTTSEFATLRYGLMGGASESPHHGLAPAIRRLTMTMLASSLVRADSASVIGMRDPDAQVRRQALLAAPNIEDLAQRRQIIEMALQDHEFIVRFEGVRSWRRFYPSECGPLVRAANDAIPAVMLIAIDALGACENRSAAQTALEAFMAAAPRSPARTPGHVSWHAHAHAVVSMARIAPGRAASVVRDDAQHPVWQVRMYAARAAAILKDTATLVRLTGDSVPGVQEAAIAGLASVEGRGADAAALHALASDAYQVVLAGATALKGAPPGDEILKALGSTLDRLTKSGRDNSRDPRMELLQRIGELGDASWGPRIEPFLQDYDPAVAERAAGILSRWSGREVTASPHRTQNVSRQLGEVAAAQDVRLRVIMSPASGGGTFVIRLRTAATPATSQRLISLAMRGYYNGLTFHRVEPTFVIQGGSPLATEYVGDGPFMRDEVDLASHVYGSVGISTRGRDTGDAQIFVNLTDNFRLDHDYTVVGEVIEGMSVVDAILEGDTMARVTVEGFR